MPRPDQRRPWFREFGRPTRLGVRARLRRLAIALGTITGLSAIVSARLMPDVVHAELGRPAPYDVYSPRTVTYEDRAATEDARQRATAATPRTYDDIGNEAFSHIRQYIDRVFSIVGAARHQSEGDALKQAQSALQAEQLALDEEAVTTLLQADDEALVSVEDACVRIAEAETLADVRTRDDEPEDVRAAERRMRRMAESEPLPRALRDAAYEVCRASFVPNQRFNAERWNEAKEAQALAVAPVTRTIQQGELIVQRGTPVDDSIMARLQQTGLLRPTVDYSRLLRRIVLTILAVVGLGYALCRYSPDVWNSLRRTATMSGLAVLSALVANLAMGVPVPGVGLIAAAAAAVMSGAVSMLLFGARASFLLIMMMSLSDAMVWDGSADAMMMAGVGGLIGMLVSERVTRLAISSLKIGVLTGASMFIAYALIAGLASAEGMDATRVFPLVGWSISLGVAAVIAAQFATRLLEAPMEVLTDMWLLELSDPRHPLLHQMMLEAPGTYNASLQVANLAGTAAQRIGENELLVRVGAMFHDVGKLKYPHFFTENQFGGANPHDALTPSMSALVLISHVKEGIERAREAGLPPRIVDSIAEHHGTTMIEYFYHKACEQEGEENVPVERYRYPGPKPQSRATATVMLADSVEATVRAMRAPSPSNIDSAVRGIVHARVDSGQLDESDLTLRDIDMITETLVRALQGIYHTRIEYPGDEELLRSGANGRNGGAHPR